VQAATISADAETSPSLRMCFSPDPRRDDRFDAAANVEIADHLHPPRFGQLGQIVENSIHRPLVEDPVVAKAPQIELETLELDTRVGWHIRDADGAEVRRAALKRFQLGGVRFDSAHWAQRREFVALHRDLIVASGVWIGERLEQIGSWHGRKNA